VISETPYSIGYARSFWSITRPLAAPHEAGSKKFFRAWHGWLFGN
jgi:hypothetical protein